MSFVNNAASVEGGDSGGRRRYFNTGAAPHLGELDALKLILRAFVAAVIYTVRSALETLTPVAPTALNISSCTCDHRRFIRQDSLRIIRMHDFEMMYDV